MRILLLKEKQMLQVLMMLTEEIKSQILRRMNRSFKSSISNINKTFLDNAERS